MLRLANATPENQLLILSIAVVELRSAVRRRERAGDISARDASSILEQFGTHLSSVFVRQAVTNRTVDLASKLIDDRGLRAYDAIQLAGCLEIAESSGHRPSTFVCSDAALLEAAAGEGLPVLDPSTWRNV